VARRPSKSWGLGRLTRYALEQMGLSEECDRQSLLSARASGIHSLRAGHALDLIAAKLVSERRYGAHLKAHRISTTKAWEDRELYRRARTEKAIAGMTRTEAKLAFGVIKPRKNKTADLNHDPTQLLDLSEYRVECCGVSELGERLGLGPDCGDLCFGDAPYDKRSLPLYDEIGTFCRTYLKPGKLLLAYAGGIYLDEVIGRLKRAGLKYRNCFAIQFPHMHKQRKLNGLKMRNGWRAVAVMSKGQYVPEFWTDDSMDGFGPQKEDDPLQCNEMEVMYWIQRLTVGAGARGPGSPADLVISCCGGVFSEGVAARRLGRRFVGCDPVQWKCRRGRERIAAVTGVYKGPLYTRWRG
jgi:hypothetical protein